MNSFWSNIFRKHTPANEAEALLRRLSIFERLSARDIETLEHILYRREFTQGEVVFHQGDPGVGMYIILRGTVAILDDATGRALAELEPGDFFGEVALLAEAPRSATARAKTACVLLGLFHPDLLGLIERRPRIGVKLLLSLAQIAGQRVVHANDAILALQEENQRLRQATAPDPAAEDEAGSVP